MYIKETEYTARPNFLKSARYQTFTHTCSDELVKTDDNGKKIVYAGSFLDGDGKVVDDGTAQGILFTTMDVTMGPLPCSLMVEGYVLTDRLPIPPTDAVKAALKEIKFY